MKIPGEYVVEEEQDDTERFIKDVLTELAEGLEGYITDLEIK